MENTGLWKDEEENLVMYLMLFYYYYVENIILVRITDFESFFNFLAFYHVIKLSFTMTFWI